MCLIYISKHKQRFSDTFRSFSALQNWPGFQWQRMDWACGMSWSGGGKAWWHRTCSGFEDFSWDFAHSQQAETGNIMMNYKALCLNLVWELFIYPSIAEAMFWRSVQHFWLTEHISNLNLFCKGLISDWQI